MGQSKKITEQKLLDNVYTFLQNLRETTRDGRSDKVPDVSTFIYNEGTPQALLEITQYDTGEVPEEQILIPMKKLPAFIKRLQALLPKG